MINEILENHIMVVESVDSWQESIKLSAEKLLEKNYITQNYVEAAINNIVKNGPYIIIIPKVAIPHSRPEDGVNETSASLLKLNKPVMYPKDNPVKVVLMLAAADKEKHLKMISSLTDLLSDQEKMAKIMDATLVEEIVNIIKMNG
ncbi:MAG TPA: PTS sugar transporter subunit IIA [Clostridia bacterium]|nr:PTS sugar transporter subunit IIA [Clostridia bacterium]